MNNNVFCLETTKSHRQNCLPIMMLYRNESSGKKSIAISEFWGTCEQLRESIEKISQFT